MLKKKHENTEGMVVSILLDVHFYPTPKSSHYLPPSAFPSAAWNQDSTLIPVLKPYVPVLITYKSQLCFLSLFLPHTQHCTLTVVLWCLGFHGHPAPSPCSPAVIFSILPPSLRPLTGGTLGQR